MRNYLSLNLSFRIHTEEAMLVVVSLFWGEDQELPLALEILDLPMALAQTLPLALPLALALAPVAVVDSQAEAVDFLEEKVVVLYVLSPEEQEKWEG